jgi:hypothetical protein
MSITRVRPEGRVRHTGVARAPDVWLAGAWDFAEFAALRQQLDPAGSWPVMAEIPSLRGVIDAAANAPEVILLADPRPGVHRQTMVDALIAAAPLSRIVVVAGSWCEGELRSGRPLTGVTRLYSHQLPAWWRQAAAALTAGLAPHWSAPTSVSPVAARGRAGRQLVSKLVLISTKDFAVFETLASTLHATGATCQWDSHEGFDVHGCDLGVWDGGQLDAGEQQRLELYCQRFAHAPAPVLVLLDYPRTEHKEAIRTAGASALLGKPYSVDALIDALSRLAASHEGSA